MQSLGTTDLKSSEQLTDCSFKNIHQLNNVDFQWKEGSFVQIFSMNRLGHCAELFCPKLGQQLKKATGTHSLR